LKLRSFKKLVIYFFQLNFRGRQMILRLYFILMLFKSLKILNVLLAIDLLNNFNVVIYFLF